MDLSLKQHAQRAEPIEIKCIHIFVDDQDEYEYSLRGAKVIPFDSSLMSLAGPKDTTNTDYLRRLRKAFYDAFSTLWGKPVTVVFDFEIDEPVAAELVFADDAAVQSISE
ncbi:hypothetical protein C9975_03055 [Thalassospira xiamenensis]|nr:hypothetical protein C9975_03055 [Thalassospira xiamenensis]